MPRQAPAGTGRASQRKRLARGCTASCGPGSACESAYQNSSCSSSGVLRKIFDVQRGDRRRRSRSVDSRATPIARPSTVAAIAMPSSDDAQRIDDAELRARGRRYRATNTTTVRAQSRTPPPGRDSRSPTRCRARAGSPAVCIASSPTHRAHRTPRRRPARRRARTRGSLHGRRGRAMRRRRDGIEHGITGGPARRGRRRPSRAG